MAGERLLVPLAESVTIRQTVGHAVRTALEEEGTPEIHFVVGIAYEADVPEGRRAFEDAEGLLDRAIAWAREDASDTELHLETDILGTDMYLFAPRDYAEQFAAYVSEHDLDRVVLDPEYRPGHEAPMLYPLERELASVGVAYEEAPVERPARHERLVGPGGATRFLGLFVISYGFYLLLGDPTYIFDLVTGVAAAAVVAATFSQVTFTTPLHPTQTPLRLARGALYVPYLLFEIIRANLAISLVILRPSLPIDPQMTRVQAAVRSGLPLTTLANSITLTPGTLTVRANDQRLLVHTLIPTAREDLFDGTLEKAVRFVFYGRRAMRIPSPRDRGDAEVLEGNQ